MGHSTQEQKQSYNNTNTYGWQTPPDTADTQALRDFKFEEDPHIPYIFGRQRQQAHDSYKNPFGGFTTPQIRDQNLRAIDSDSAQNEAQAHVEDKASKQGMEFGKLATVAGMTGPRLTQTGGSGNSGGTSTYSDSPLDNIVKGASAAGSMAML